MDKSIASHLVCSFPCTKSEDFLYWDSTCSAECKAPYEIAQLNGKNLCIFPCPNGETYYFPNGTCKNECPAPLVPKGQHGSKQLCLFPCDDDEYVDSNGKCLKECPFPSTQQITQDNVKICISPCAKEGEFKDLDGTCKSMDLPGQFALDLIFKDKPAKVTFIDKIMSADSATFSLYARDFTLSSSYTFFGLNSMGEYFLDN